MGELPVGPSLAVSVHLDACPACRSAALRIEDEQGAVLSRAMDAPLSAGALEDVLARLEAASDRPGAEAPRSSPIPLPPVLERIGFQPTLHLPGGSWVAHLDAPRVGGWRTYLLCCPPQTAVPGHGHTDDELIVVLEGAFRDTRAFDVGDFAEYAAGSAHDMQVTPHSRLVALISSREPIAWRVGDRNLGAYLDI